MNLFENYEGMVGDLHGEWYGIDHELTCLCSDILNSWLGVVGNEWGNGLGYDRGMIEWRYFEWWGGGPI